MCDFCGRRVAGIRLYGEPYFASATQWSDLVCIRCTQNKVFWYKTDPMDTPLWKTEIIPCRRKKGCALPRGHKDKCDTLDGLVV